MKLMNILKRIKCKITFCVGSKCSLNDNENYSNNNEKEMYIDD